MTLDAARHAAVAFALQNAAQHAGKATQGAVMGRLLAWDPDLKDRAKEVAPVVAQVVAEVNALPPALQAERLAATPAPELKQRERRTGLPALPEHPVMRFAPNPNGPPTLGHARGIVIHGEYRRTLGGKLILRFDDTDPVTKKPQLEAYDAFRDALRWLGIPVDQEVVASTRLPVYYEHCAELVRRGGAYVCECEAEAFRELKQAARPCPHRDQPAAASLAKWRAMLDGGYRPGQATVRVRTDIEHANAALRDWVAFRILDVKAHPHPVTGTKFHVWPLLDFESAIEDHVHGVTHIIRGKDLADSERKQRFLYQHMGWDYPEALHWGRVQLEGFGKFSTTGLKASIDRGEYTGWDDPRLPSLAALRRRGIQPEAIRRFWLALGLTEKDVSVSFENLAAENRKVVDMDARRAFLVLDPEAVVVAGMPSALVAHPPVHPERPDWGTRALTPGSQVLLERRDLDRLAPGGKVRLKDAANVTYDGERLTFASAAPEPGLPIIHWLPADAPPCRVVSPDAPGGTTGRIEASVCGLAANAVFQAERIGYYRVEVAGAAPTIVFGHP